MSRPKRAANTKAKADAAEVPASEVKNAWHEFVDRVARTRQEIVVTRYGKPVMKMSPVDPPRDASSIVGCLAGTVTFHGDVVKPTGEVWEADA